jgi:hypothetical protein
MNEDIQNKIYNIDIVLDEIKEFPQTCGTILKGKLNNSTYETILRRKLNTLCNDGMVCKSLIPGTRFSRVIFYCLPKRYTILVENLRTGVEVFTFYDFIKEDDIMIKVSKYWKLKDTYWEEYNTERTFLSGNILKWI